MSGDLVADDDFCYVTTTGRRTGRPHRIEIWYARAADTLYILAGGGRRSDWVRNVEANSSVTVELDGVAHAATARVVAGQGEEGEARRLVFEKYQPRYGGDLASWRQDALPIALDLHV